jgi:nicotinate-nucleotide adenylyltransferase
MPPARHIAIFGGTFDPVHLGHTDMAARARAEFDLSEVRFMPCRISPHKTDTVPTPAAARLAMLRLATGKLPWAVVDDFETRREGPSYSWQTAEAMRESFPNARLFWLLGGDQWDSLPRWNQPERLAACVEFIVSARGAPPTRRAGYRMHSLAGDHPASATAIRAAIAAGTTRHPWLDPAVAEWIATHQLYQHHQS